MTRGTPGAPGEDVGMNVTSDNAASFGSFSEHRKTATTRISDFTMPPGTTYQTPEGLRAEDEETRIAFDVQGGVYPIRESVFRASYAAALSSPETTPAGVLDALWQCGVESGMDTDGDAGPGALVAGMGEAGFAAAMVKEVRRLRLAYDECLSEPAGVLDEAWAAAEEALPEGWWFEVYPASHKEGDVNPHTGTVLGPLPGPYVATAQPAWYPLDEAAFFDAPVYDGPTPAAALRALAAALGRSGEPK